MRGMRGNMKSKNISFDKTFDRVVVCILIIFLLIVAYPLYFVIIASISTPSAVVSGQVILLPKGFSLEGYRKIIEYKQIWKGYANTIIYVILQTLLSVSVTMMAGYALSRKKYPGRTAITVYLTIPMYFSGGLIPTYLWMDKMGLVGNPLVIVLLGAVSVYNVFIARSFIASNIPDELYEAASMDGCSHVKFFLSVVLPLSPAILAVLTLFSAVGQWNSWFNAMLYLKDEAQMPLQAVIRQLITSQSALALATDTGALQGEDMVQQALLTESIKYAVIIVSTLPIMCLYPFVQRYFVKGIMIGSVKG
ncbi:MAG: carbohydrate ABC transporter permease [Lachnospiraceae bacterium]|nr:carbohydrate ABC transporter permease [Lachnospiraceae bacterium]